VEEKTTELNTPTVVEEPREVAMPNTNVGDIIKQQYDKKTNELAADENFQRLTQEVIQRQAKAKLSEDMLAVLDKEHKNELSQYYLKCEKEKLQFRKKKEKKIIIEEVRSEVFAKKLENLKRRYGYLYKKDSNGEPIDFIPSKSYNRQRELTNWWNGLGDNFKRIVKGTFKILIWGAILVGGSMLLYEGFTWFATNMTIPQV
jgi:hypothetical protein